MARTMEDVTVQDMVDEGGFLETPGTYLLQVAEMLDGLLPDGKTVADCFSAKCTVIGGDQDGKSIGLLFNDGDYSHKDQGKFARKKQSAFLIATNVLRPEHLNGQPVSYDEQQAVGQFFVSKLKFGREGKDGKRYLEVNYADVWHIDDPRVPKGIVTPEAVADVDAALRRKPEFFASMVKTPKRSAPADTTSSLNEDDVEL